MINLLQDVWEKEEVVTEWKTGYTVKILKKGDLSDCQKLLERSPTCIGAKQIYTNLILERIRKRPVWGSTILSYHMKLRPFNSNVKSVLLYGIDTWRHTKKLDHKLQVFINTCLCQILCFRWPERISNQEL